jgi:pyruvate/2-oxoglutarate dehydrogenase complex dihydrolipoamide acyltransferase (E2) component
MSSFGVRSATPIVVPPSLATLFIGEPFQVPVPSPHGIAWSQETKLVLAFNHNRFNGAGAARFLRDIHRNIEEADKP